MKEILKGIHLLSLGGVNAYLVDHGKLTLIDSGYAGNGEKIVDYIHKIGKKESDLENIILTHLHSDHSGSLAELKTMTGARIFAHIHDAPLVEQGISFRETFEISPGFFNKLVFRFFVKNAPRTITPVEIDQVIGEQTGHLPIGKGFEIIPVPGHASGQMALLYPDHGGVLFAADTTGNMMGLGIAPFYEDYAMGIRDIQKLCELQFNGILFGHGKPILKDASTKFRNKFRKLIQANPHPLVSNR